MRLGPVLPLSEGRCGAAAICLLILYFLIYRSLVFLFCQIYRIFFGVLFFGVYPGPSLTLSY